MTIPTPAPESATDQPDAFEAAYRAERARLVERLWSISESFEEVPLGRGQRSTAFLLDGAMLVLPRIQLRAKPIGGGSCYWVSFDEKIVKAARSQYTQIASAIVCGSGEQVIVLTPSDLAAVLAARPRARTRGAGGIWDPLIERRGTGTNARWTMRYWNERRERAVMIVNDRLNAFQLLGSARRDRAAADPLLVQRERLLARIATLGQVVEASSGQWSGDDGDRAHMLNALEEHATALAQLQALDAQIAAATRAREAHESEDESRAADMPADVGAQVIVREDDGSLARYTLVSPGAAAPGAGWVSTASPIGRALLGRRAGETVAVQAPGGSYDLMIVSVEHAPGAEHRRAV